MALSTSVATVVIEPSVMEAVAITTAVAAAVVVVTVVVVVVVIISRIKGCYAPLHSRITHCVASGPRCRIRLFDPNLSKSEQEEYARARIICV